MRYLLVIGLFLVSLAIGKNADAYVFSNLDNYTVTSNAETAYMGSSDHRYNSFLFTSSTLQLELTDVTLRMTQASYANTLPVVLHVATDDGEWSTTNTATIPYGSYATTTFVFPSPHPYAAAGDTWDFWFDPPATSTPLQVWAAMSTTTNSHFTEFWQFSGCDWPVTSCTGQTDLVGTYAPEVAFNASDLGGMTVTIPGMGDYDFSTTTAQGLDLGYFGNMTRDVLVYLFVPNGSKIQNDIATVNNTVSTRWPFSYFYTFQSDFNSSMAATTTSSTTLTLDFSTVATNTSFGTFMPTSVTMFSSSTVSSIADPDIWVLLKFIIAMTLYIALAERIYYGVTNLFNEGR